MRIQAIVTCLYFVLVFPADIIGLWWAVGSPLVMDSNSICKKTKRLAGRQKTICKREPEVVAEVAKGAKLALMECKFQFRNRQWNCTTAKRSITQILNKNIREAAFVYASTAAGVVYAVTNACSTGLLHQCTCDHSVRDRSTDGEWEWGGCGDNVEYGYRKSREFMDARKRKQRGDFTAMIQLHNNEAGRLAVKNYMRKECKCHGLSGSCALKTCWRKMPPFRDVGNRLKERFDGAIKVIISNDGNSIIPDGKDLKSPSKLDLVYSDTSPDFCKKNKKLGSLGTKGRECDPESPGVGGCDLLCCNRGYSKEQVTVMEYCKCRFHWCCEVICDTCEVTKILNRCK
ncbi:protein Wnt-6-like isoform X1 [Biomphalaria glabrata]|uniref:Protein Wnt n=3 Tax=Biomphalaria TaxID=6525 RepID=A0A9W2Z4X4_BIOGL|nr:protein Wnt-6-like isoform X1 [Biomphalaria glabrata]XP_055870046.1 protein Wnt-6-like isoform X1 [Biomphalaria glabrata]